MMLNSALDQGLALTPVELKLLERVDKIIDEAIEEKDDTQIVNLSKTIQRTGHACALAQAKLLWRWNEAFKQFDVGDDFVDYAYTEVGLSQQTVRKYLSVWENIFENETVAEDIRKRLLNVPMQSLILVAPAAAEDELKPEDWQTIANAPDRATIRDTVRRIRGEVSSSKNAMTIMIKRDGTLMARKLDDYVSFGFLDPDPKDPVAKQAIERILRCANIVRQ